MSGFFTKVVDFFSGGIGGKLVEEIAKHFPPGMSEAEKANAKLAIAQLDHERQVELLKLAKESDELFNQRIRDLEGTASDLKSVPFIGPVVLFARGTQRPLWGFATMYIDYKWFSHQWTFDDQQAAAAYVINILVLGFLFGERALANVLPYVTDLFKARRGEA